MTSSMLDRPFECAPHAARSAALALALSLNLAIVVLALIPQTQPMRQAPLPQLLIATLLQPPPPAMPPPAPPILQVVKPAITPSMPAPAMHPVPVQIGALPTLAPVAPLQTATSSSNAALPAAADDREATIAYATATPPPYPIQAIRAGIQGTVLLKVLVDPSGKPERVMIERSSGSHALDDAARSHVLAAWRFHPAMRGGHAIAAWALVPVRFDLNNG